MGVVLVSRVFDIEFHLALGRLSLTCQGLSLGAAVVRVIRSPSSVAAQTTIAVMRNTHIALSNAAS